MTRKDYIAGLEEIRKSVQKIGQAFAAVDLTDATNMESDRHKKTKELVADLCDRLYEDIAISAKVAADNADKPEEAAYAYLHEHNTPVEGNDVDKACVVIRALLSRTQKPAKPANPFNNGAEDLL